MTRIALIAGTYQPDRCGVAHYTARLREHLQKQNIESIVLTTRAAVGAIAQAEIKGVVQDWRLVDLIPLVRAIETANVDILHIQHAAGTYGFQRAIFLLPLLLRARGWRSPIVTTVHEYGWWEWQPANIPPRLLEWLKQWGQRHGWWDREDGFLLTLSDAIITTNAEAEAVIQARLPNLAQPVRRIPIGANIEVAAIARPIARQLLQEKCNWSEDALVIAFFGFLHPVKGLETLLHAFKQVQTLRSQARLLLIGGVESLALRGKDAAAYWDKLHSLVSVLELEQSVHLTGYLPGDIASHYLAGADIGVLPFNHGVTLKSGSLLTLLAHRLPVVATRPDPADPDLSDERIVRLVAPRDRDALIAALLELSTEADLRVRLQKAGLAFVQQFSWSAIAQSHLSVYHHCSLK